MKARLVENEINFKRGQKTIDGLDVGVQRSDNPNNYANISSYKLNDTNEEFLEEIIAELLDFHQSVAMDMSPYSDDEGSIKNWPRQNIPQIGSLRVKMHSIENSLEDLIEFLKSVKR